MTDIAINEQGEEVTPKPKHAGGRPTLYSDAIAQVICDYLAEGTSITASIGMVGIDRQTYLNWQQDRPEFFEMTTRARAEGERRFSRVMLRAAEGDPEFKGDYRAAESVLKRQFLSSGWGDQLDIRKVDASLLTEMLRLATEANVVPNSTIAEIEAGDEDI